jgi:hypothetical protein
MNSCFPLIICSAVLLLAALVASSPTPAAHSNRLVLSPALQPGQKILYHLHFTTEKKTRSESRVVSPMVPESASADTDRLLEAEVKSVSGAPGHSQVVLLTRMTQPDGSPLAGSDGNVEFTLIDDGRANDVKGLDALSANEQSLWRQWLSQFALSWTFPLGGIKPGDKWKKEEPIVGTALAALVWEKQFEYVGNEPCPQRADAATKTQKPQAFCAVVVISSSIKQKSPRDDATPDDYKIHKLKTSGTARGKTQVISYISLRTRLLERATEESVQAMDIIIAKADDSNQVHFNLDAASRGEVFLVQ